MGTRSVIQVVGCTDTPPDQAGAYSGSVRLYRHNDGDPRDCLPAIARSIEMMERLVQTSLLWKREQVRHIAVEPMAHAIIANSMSNISLAVQVEKLYTGAPRLLQLGDQSDLEWLYVVDCKNLLVNVYTSKQGNAAGQTLYSATPVEHLEAGFFKEAERVFREEYQPEAVDAALTDFADGVKAVAATGWRFNAYSSAKAPGIPIQRRQPFRFKPTSRSSSNPPPIPIRLRHPWTGVSVGSRPC